MRREARRARRRGRSRRGASRARGGLGRAEDARGATLLLRGLLALGVRRDDDALAVRQLAAGDDRVDLLGVERLALEQRACEPLQDLALLREELPGLGVRVEDEAADLVVDLVRDRLGVVAPPAREVAAEEHALL